MFFFFPFENSSKHLFNTLLLFFLKITLMCVNVIEQNIQQDITNNIINNNSRFLSSQTRRALHTHHIQIDTLDQTWYLT